MMLRNLATRIGVRLIMWANGVNEVSWWDRVSQEGTITTTGSTVGVASNVWITMKHH